MFINSPMCCNQNTHTHNTDSHRAKHIEPIYYHMSIKGNKKKVKCSNIAVRFLNFIILRILYQFSEPIV